MRMRAAVGRGTRTLIVGGIACVGMLAAAPAASAAFGLTSPNAQPANLQAGANSDLAITIDVEEAEAQLRDLTIHLPPGLVGNPLATPLCTEEELESAETDGAGCPAESAVGTVSNSVDLYVQDLPTAVEETVTGNVYNVVPRQGEPARFGIILKALPFTLPVGGSAVLPPIVLQSPAALRQSDFGLDTILTDLPQSAEVVPELNLTATIDITSITLNLAGQVGDPPQGFLRNPTSCTPATISFDGRAWDGQTASGQAPSFTPTNCAALPFHPELKASGKPKGLGKPMEFSNTISQTIEEAGLANAQVILPNGITGNNDLLGTTCPRTDFEAGNCPANTIVGTASATSPLQLQALTGTVALVEPVTPGLPDIGLDLRGPLALKLTGSLSLDPGGRAVTTFAGLPDIPIADFKLTFSESPGFVFAGVDLCRESGMTVEGRFKAFSGAETTVNAPITFEGCGDNQGNRKKPKAKIKVAKQGSKHPAMKLKVKAGSEKLRQVSVKMPRELGFAGGKAFKRGSSVKAGGKKLKGKAVKHTKRSLKLKAKGAVKSFKGKFSGRALKASKKLKPSDRLKFKVKVRDKTGKTTKLTVRAK